MRKIDMGAICDTLAKKPLCFPIIAPAPSVQILIQHSHDNPYLCNLISTAENMSSSVHVRDSATHIVILLQASYWLYT